MSWTETFHDTPDALAVAIAAALAKATRTALAERGLAVLALAGGRTPLPAYRKLAQSTLDWSRVVVLPTDERWVGHDHPARNDRELQAAFGAAGGARVLPLVPIAPGPLASAAFAESALATLAGPFDAVLLGMGADGHFASLFPGATELMTGLDPGGAVDALAVHPDPLPPEAPYARVSLGAARLVRTRKLLLAVTGAAKRAVLEDAMAGRDAMSLPIAAVLHDPAARLEIHWSP
jgi:6-phosphogluconolactonase